MQIRFSYVGILIARVMFHIIVILKNFRIIRYALVIDIRLTAIRFLITLFLYISSITPIFVSAKIYDLKTLHWMKCNQNVCRKKRISQKLLGYLNI